MTTRKYQGWLAAQYIYIVHDEFTGQLATLGCAHRNLAKPLLHISIICIFPWNMNNYVASFDSILEGTFN